MNIFEESLPTADLQIAKRNGVPVIKCLSRNTWLKLTPEEWVRQHVIHYLVHQRGMIPSRIATEVQVKSMGQNRRSDIVVYTEDFTPLLLVECKANHIKISDKTLIQMGNYVNKLNARFAWMTNGQEHGIVEFKNDVQVYHSALPDFR